MNNNIIIHTHIYIFLHVWSFAYTSTILPIDVTPCTGLNNFMKCNKNRFGRGPVKEIFRLQLQNSFLTIKLWLYPLIVNLNTCILILTLNILILTLHILILTLNILILNQNILILTLNILVLNQKYTKN